MSSVLPWLVLLGALYPAWIGLKFIGRSFRRAAHVIVTLEKAAKIVLYELVPNDGDSIKDKANRGVAIAEENQRALEMHLIDHQQGRAGPPIGTPEGF